MPEGDRDVRGLVTTEGAARAGFALQSAIVQVASLGFRTDLAILRLGGSGIEDRADHLIVTTAQIPTYWWGNFVLVAGVPTDDECERWLDRFGSEFPGAGHVAIGLDRTTGSLADVLWFTARGFSAEALAVMTATRTALHPPARLNRDAVVRELHGDDDWEASVDLRARCATIERAAAAWREFDRARAARRWVSDNPGRSARARLRSASSAGARGGDGRGQRSAPPPLAPKLV